MIGHLRIPNFYARILQERENLAGEPLLVVDHGRIIDVSPEAGELGYEADQLLEDEQIQNITRENFDLDFFLKKQKQIEQIMEDSTPIIESLVHGELFAEVEDEDTFREIFKTMKSRLDLPITGGLTATGWLARILSFRSEPNELSHIAKNSYETALQTVEVDEIWGLGDDFVSTLREEGTQSLSEVYHMNEADRRKRYGRTARALHRLFEGDDPRPLNPFSRPKSISQDFQVNADASNETTLDQLKSTVRNLCSTLEGSKVLSHKIKITLRAESGKTQVNEHVFSNPTSQAESLLFAADSMFTKFTFEELPATMNVELTALVADVGSYHTEVEETHDELQIM